MNAPIPLHVGEEPYTLMQQMVAARYAFSDAVRSAYLDRCCREDFKREKDYAEAIEKARVTRERNAEIRRQRLMATTLEAP